CFRGPDQSGGRRFPKPALFFPPILVERPHARGSGGWIVVLRIILKRKSEKCPTFGLFASLLIGLATREPTHHRDVSVDRMRHELAERATNRPVVFVHPCLSPPWIDELKAQRPHAHVRCVSDGLQ